MPRLLGRSLLAATIAYAFSAESVEAQQDAPDSSAYPVVHLDSALIRTLPLVRSVEIPSFLPSTISDNIDLASMATAGTGVRNEVDLYMLQKAEQRFGNGDGMFSAAEQQAAFGAAVEVQALSLTPLSQSRKIQIGLQIDF